jgi:hypothetical protein
VFHIFIKSNTNVNAALAVECYIKWFDIVLGAKLTHSDKQIRTSAMKFTIQQGQHVD